MAGTCKRCKEPIDGNLRYPVGNEGAFSEMALFDCFLKIDGIEGESADSKHKGEIDVKSFS